MVGRLVSWWRGNELPIWKQLAHLTQLELKDGEFVTRGETGQPTAYHRSGSTASDTWLRVNVRTERTER